MDGSPDKLECDGAASAADFTGTSATTGDSLEALWLAIPYCWKGSLDPRPCKFCIGGPTDAILPDPSNARGESFCNDGEWTAAAVDASGEPLAIAIPVL